MTTVIATRVPGLLGGQVELRLDAPELTDQLRTELATYVIDGWQAMAQCRTVIDDSWFPDTAQPAQRAAAVAQCACCPVRRSCLAYALSQGEDYGIWGGTTDIQRAALKIDLTAGIPATDVLDSATIRPANLWTHTT